MNLIVQDMYLCGNSAELGSSVELPVSMHVDKLMVGICLCHCQSVCLSQPWWPVTYQMHTYMVQLHVSTAIIVTYYCLLHNMSVTISATHCLVSLLLMTAVAV